MAININDNGCLISTSAVKTLITKIKNYSDSAAIALLGENTDSTSTMTLHGIKNYSSSIIGENTDSTSTMTLYGIKNYSGSAISEAINSLDVNATSASNATTAYYISQISEADGKIAATAVAVEQTYSSTGIKPVSGKSIAAAIAGLDSNISATTDGYVIKGITITDGKITNSNFLNLNPSLSSTNATGNNTQKLNVSVGGISPNDSIALNEATTTTYGVVKKHFATSATLSFATSATSATISVTGVTTSNTVIVSPLANDVITVGNDTLSSWEIWRDAGVRCSSQANNQLTFKSDETPAANTKFNVIILN